MENTNKVHYYWLDAIRFIAAFLVLLSHCRNTFFPEYGDLPEEQHNLATMLFTFVCRLGHEAVIVFFVLSGFLVGGRGLENIKSGTMNVKSYAVDRFARIYPPLIAAIVFCGITSIVTCEIKFEWWCAIGNLLNLQGICCDSLVSPFWSLSYEVWFYVILGALAALFLSRSDKSKILSFVALILALSVFFVGLKIHYFLIWFIGAIAYSCRPKNKNIIVLFLSFIGIIASILFFQLSKETHYLSFALIGINQEFVELLIAVMCCLFIQQVILFEPQSKITKITEYYLGVMANFSYTLYLSHRIVFLWIIAYLWPKDVCDFSLKGIIIFATIIIVTFLCCYVIYFVSERHTSKIRFFLKNVFLC